MYILFLFWWGPTAATVTTITVDSLTQCQSVKRQLTESNKKLPGDTMITCVAK
jgi:hypothetical protein